MFNLIQYTPSREMRRFQSEIDRLFENYFAPGQAEGETKAPSWTPRVDLGETEEAYQIYLDVPGTAKDKLEISYHEGLLSVSGEREETLKPNGEKALHLERVHGHFHRTFRLPEAVDSSRIEARYEDGVLKIDIPKVEEVKPRRIQVS